MESQRNEVASSFGARLRAARFDLGPGGLVAACTFRVAVGGHAAALRAAVERGGEPIGSAVALPAVPVAFGVDPIRRAHRAGLAG